MGNSVSTTASNNIKNDLKNECPIKHTERNKTILECPAHPLRSANSIPVYNVYGQEIDPTNNMPHNPNQEPNIEQKYPLDTNRVLSTIPKGGTEDTTWMFPSDQMFFNALKRKGKDDDVHEGHISSVVSIHNNMNENTWKQVKKWEEEMKPNSKPKLLKFMGRPNDLTPLAYIKKLFGYGTPFDRHDWYVIRNDGKTIRYVIDYYFDENKNKFDKIPSLQSIDSIQSISIYARPAIESFETLFCRLSNPFKTLFNEKIQEKVQENPKAIIEKANDKLENSIKNESKSQGKESVDEIFHKIQEKCKDNFKEMKNCTSNDECARKATVLQYCMGTIICPKEAENFGKQFFQLNYNEDAVNNAFNDMTKKIQSFEQNATEIMREQAIKDAENKN